MLSEFYYFPLSFCILCKWFPCHGLHRLYLVGVSLADNCCCRRTIIRLPQSLPWPIVKPIIVWVIALRFCASRRAENILNRVFIHDKWVIGKGPASRLCPAQNISSTAIVPLCWFTVVSNESFARQHKQSGSRGSAYKPCQAGELNSCVNNTLGVCLQY